MANPKYVIVATSCLVSVLSLCSILNFSIYGVTSTSLIFPSARRRFKWWVFENQNLRVLLKVLWICSYSCFRISSVCVFSFELYTNYFFRIHIWLLLEMSVTLSVVIRYIDIYRIVDNRNILNLSLVTSVWNLWGEDRWMRWLNNLLLSALISWHPFKQSWE